MFNLIKLNNKTKFNKTKFNKNIFYDEFLFVSAGLHNIKSHDLI